MSKKSDIDKYLVLHCKGRFAEEALSTLTSAIVAGFATTGHGQPIPMCVPVITTSGFEAALEAGESDDNPFELSVKIPISNRIIAPWCGKHGLTPYLQADIPARSLRKLTTLKGPIDTLIIKEGTLLDLDRVKRLREFLSENNSVSFIIPEKDKRPRNVIDFIKLLGQQFEFLFEAWAHLPHIENEIMAGQEKDELISILNFFNVKTVVPVLDSRKVDGIAFSLQHVLRSSIARKRLLEPTDTMFFIFSNFLENIIYLDGSQINDYHNFDGNSIDRLSRVLRRKAMVKASMGGGGGTKKSKTEEKPSLKSVMENMKESDMGTAASSWTYTSSSASTAYYR